VAKFCSSHFPSLPKTPSTNGSTTPREKSWRLKSSINVFRHADRTPKSQSLPPCSPVIYAIDAIVSLTVKLKFNFKGTQPWVKPFIDLLQGRTDEIILRKEDQLQYISNAADAALKCPDADTEKLEQLKLILSKKLGFAGTKAQIKPSFNEQGECEKLGIVVKWGGEVRVKSWGRNSLPLAEFLFVCQFTHAGRYQSRDLGENMRKDLSIMNKSVARFLCAPVTTPSANVFRASRSILDATKIYTSSE
jgi:inositol hexakisphosphate/diphosphoinositol-pentakisphosphate kinase